MKTSGEPVRDSIIWSILPCSPQSFSEKELTQIKTELINSSSKIMILAELTIIGNAGIIYRA